MKIIIEAPAGAGKTLVGTLISRFLRRMGYTVNFKHEARDHDYANFHASTVPGGSHDTVISIYEMDPTSTIPMIPVEGETSE